MLIPVLIAANEMDTASVSVHEAAVMEEAENPRCQWSGVGGSVLRGKQGRPPWSQDWKSDRKEGEGRWKGNKSAPSPRAHEAGRAR